MNPTTNIVVSLVISLCLLYVNAATFEYTILTTDANIPIRMYDHYTSDQVSTFYVDSLPDDSTEGSLYQTTSGTSPNAVEITTAGNPDGVITHTTGTIFFVPFTSPAPEMRVEIAVVGLDASNAVFSDDTIVIYVSQACPAIPNLSPSWGINNVNPPPPSDVSISFNEATNKFDIEVEVTYLRDDVAYLIDFSDFDPSGVDDLRDVQAGSGNCGARVAMSPSNIAWEDMWASAPHAQFDDALIDGVLYPAYAPINTPLWSVQATTCSTLLYTASFAFSDLAGCRQRVSPTTPSIQITQSTQSSIVYSGTLFVNALRPVDTTDESAAYQRAQFAYGFQFTFVRTFQALVGLSSSQNFEIQVLSTALDNDGGLIMNLRTRYTAPTNDGLVSPVVTPKPDGTNSIAVALAPPDNAPCVDTAECVQTWTAAFDPAWLEGYNGDYVFNWTDASDPSTFVYAILTIDQQVEPVDQTGAHSLANEIGLHTTAENWIDAEAVPETTPTFVSGDTVYVRSDVTVDAEDSTNFVLTINNAWVCFTDNDNYVIEYANGKLGCNDPFILASQKVKLVDTAAVVTNGAAGDFDTYVAPNSAFETSGSVAVGLRFVAQPLSFQSRPYVVHLELVLTQQTGGKKKRTVQYVTAVTSDNIGDGLASFTVEEDREDNEEGGAGGALLSIVALLISTLLYLGVMTMM